MHGPKRLTVQSHLPFDYWLRPTASPAELILLLHGFAETGERILSKLVSTLPENAVVVAPNGPFLMPHKKDDKYFATYAWYFYDPALAEYFIDMQTAVECLQHGIEALGMKVLPKRIIGFSQGGYLAPIVAQSLEGVTQVVGISCETLVDEIPGYPQFRPEFRPQFRVDAIHGSMDEAVSLRDAQSAHLKWTRSGFPGTFSTLDGVGHRIEDTVRSALRRVLQIPTELSSS